MTDETIIIAAACGFVSLVVFWIIADARRRLTGKRWVEKSKFNKVHVRM